MIKLMAFGKGSRGPRGQAGLGPDTDLGDVQREQGQGLLDRLTWLGFQEATPGQG